MPCRSDSASMPTLLSAAREGGSAWPSSPPRSGTPPAAAASAPSRVPNSASSSLTSPGIVVGGGGSGAASLPRLGIQPGGERVIADGRPLEARDLGAQLGGEPGAVGRQVGVRDQILGRLAEAELQSARRSPPRAARAGRGRPRPGGNRSPRIEHHDALVVGGITPQQHLRTVAGGLRDRQRPREPGRARLEVAVEGQSGDECGRGRSAQGAST